uniref:uncharacterized protein LOC124067939 n=1 Tax=Scatophagus argus TaxID=75038 RepID=UPI001ED841E5|nr:uncharacterized protein LOC124067939 [Scatophagus argus]
MAPASLTEMPPNFIIKDSVKMIVFCMTLVLLHQGYTLVPVTTVQLGEPATFTCTFLDDKISQRQLHWYKQSAGDNLKSIVTLRKHVTPMYGSAFSASRMDVKVYENMSNLTIRSTISEDEGMYHCAVVDWIQMTWSGTYLLFKGNTQRTSNYTVVQWPTVSDPVRPGDSVTFQCSVLSDSDSNMCRGGRSVFWFRAGLDKSHPNIIYADGNRHDECEMRSDTQKSCVYRLTKDINSTDAGTYYCAVATCGEIIFGDGSKLDVQGTSIWSSMANGIIVLLCAVLAISLTVIAFLIYTIKKNKCDCCNAAFALQKNSGGHKSQRSDEGRWIYSTVIFTMMKTNSGAIKDAKTPERERIYAAAGAFGFDS